MDTFFFGNLAGEEHLEEGLGNCELGIRFVDLIYIYRW